ncbi:MAG: DUF177 domain-containing protein [Desulfuromonadales bacterium]
MRIRIDDIKENGLTLDFLEDVENFPGLSEAGAVEGFVAPLSIHLRVIRVHELIEVEGKIETSIRLFCSRCLESFESFLAIPFSLAYARELPEAAADSEEDEVELSAEDLGLIPFQGEEIDLRDGIREQILMSLPLQPLCNMECRGLCPQCGIDLNQSTCDCSQPELRNQFGALKNFKVEKKKDR